MNMTSFILACIILGPNKPHFPKWYDNMLAGYELAYDEKHNALGVFDARTGFMLIRDVECDGAVVELLLTRDRKEVVHDYSYIAPNYKPAKGEGAVLQMVKKPLPSLKTGKGITIGDTRLAVQAKLGRPTKIEKKVPYVSFMYEFSSGKTENERDYSETYTFRGNKLVEISFACSDITEDQVQSPAKGK